MENFSTQDKHTKFLDQSDYDERRCHPMDRKAMDFMEGMVDAFSIIGSMVSDYRDDRKRLARLEQGQEELRRLLGKDRR